MAGGPAEELDDILAHSRLRSLFQPIVDLETRTVLAYEALTRGPAGSVLELPDALFETARAEGRLAELDSACRIAAFSAARRAGLDVPRGLFVNSEPEALGGVAGDVRPSTPSMVLEITERVLTADPAQLLRSVAHLRSLGWSIALDDVGADSASIALLPLIDPDVIKLDLRLARGRPDQHSAFVMNVITAHSEITGAVIIAEGIETEQQLDSARAMGATLGQGWLFGRPAPLPQPLPPVPGLPVVQLAAGCDEPAAGDTPFDLVVRHREPRASSTDLLVEISTHLESRALASGDSAVVLSSFQDARNVDARVAERYRVLGERAALVGVLAEGLTATFEGALGRVQLADIQPTDALLTDWNVAVVTPDFAALLAARQTGPPDARGRPRFSFVLTHDRALVIAAARMLALRL